MELCLIWAQARNRAIGKNNTLPWHIPEDLRQFKALTKGHPVIMGRNTFASLPAGPLPDRQNIVLSSQGGSFHPNAITALNMRQALEFAGASRPARVFIIGGQVVYEQALRIADTVFMTEVDLEIEGADAFAPEIPDCFRCSDEGAWLTSQANGIRYRLKKFRRERRF